MHGDGLLDELIAAKENIKRKYSALKRGDDIVQAKVIKTLKPIIDPLNKIQQQTNYNPTEYINTLPDKPVSVIDTDSTNLSIDKTKSSYDNWFLSPDLDKTYGPKKSYRNNIILGKHIIKFTDNKTIVIPSSKSEYNLTGGLLELIFLKSPTNYTEQDLETYKSILIQTSAHLTLNGSTIRKGGNKYTNIISNLFHPGRGLHMKLQKNNLVYWNDSNELVDRLQILLASRSAGNTGVGNEILSIFEELLEAGIIKRIPNV